MASEFGGSPDKKKVKIKNSTPDKQFSAATFDDVFPTSTFLNKKKEQNFKELSDLYNEISKEEEEDSINETTLTEEPEQQKEDSTIVEESQLDRESSPHSNQSTNENDNSSTAKTQNFRTPHLKLKVVKLKYGDSDKFKFVDFNNRLVTFCGECANCQRKKDCGKCRHCR